MEVQPVYDYLIAGAGFAGSVLAERLAGTGKRILLVDKREHVGGNAFDYYNEDGILVHKYGPHIFHTNSMSVFEYLSLFTEWRSYEHRVLASVEGKLLPIPINLDTVNGLYGLQLEPEDLPGFFAKRAEPRSKVRTSEDVVVSKVGRDLYEKFFQGYTRKQWGLDPSQLDATVAGRIPVRLDREDRYFTDEYQCMPRDGYTRMFERMLANPLIEVELGTEFSQVRDSAPHREVIYTGAVDAFFNYSYGRLPYRSLEFELKTLRQSTFQQTGTVNWPNDHAYTRVTEFKHLTGQQHEATTICYEYPRDDGDPYYPVPRPQNAETYQKYQRLAAAMNGVHFVGRLATYKYYNMDQVVAQALAMFDSLRLREGVVGGTKE